MKITKRQLRRIIREETHEDSNVLGDILDAVTSAAGEEEAAEFDPLATDEVSIDVPHPEDYDATRALLKQNPELVDLGIDVVMDAAGTSCERSTTQGIVDHLEGTLASPAEEEFSFTGDVAELPGEEAFAVGLEAGRQGLTEMRLSKKQLKRIIREEISAIEDRPLEVEVEEDAWAGGECLVDPIDYQKVTTGVAVEPGIEVEQNYGPPLGQESYNRMRVYRGQKDLGKPHKVSPIVLERYYDAMVCGRLEEAADILESHLDSRFPGWQDYEWLS